MKNTVLILSIICMMSTNAQQSFEKLWSQVEAFEKEGKTKSANELVTNIYQKAKKKQNTNQLIKSLLYQSKYALVLQEDAELDIVNNLNREIKEATFPANTILQSILADFKWQYFNQHRWEIYNRTQTTEVVNEDFRTWDLNRLFTSINENFKQSIAPAKALQNIVISDYQYILIKNDANLQNLRPTLYDFLAHRALGFFNTSESRITKPKERFYIDNNDYFNPSVAFTQLNIQANDSILSQLEVLKTYQKLEAFHIQKNNTDALTDVHLARLQFVRQNSTIANKEQTYIESLQNSFQKLKKGNAYAIIKATYAQTLFQNTTTEKNPEDRKKALAICETISTQYPKTEGGILASNVKARILQKHLTIQNEACVPTTSSKVLVHYNNLKQLYFRIYPVHFEHNFNTINYKDRAKEIKSFFKSQPFTHSFKTDLPQKEDYFQHSTEVVIPELQVGKYLILVSEDAEFNTDKTFAWSYQSVSNLVAIESSYQNKKIFQILDRVSGKPIENATVRFGRNDKKTNDIGEVSFTGKRRNEIVTVTTSNDTLHLGKYYHHSYNNTKQKDRNKEKREKAFLFLDRSIYRPGQKVQFKGIVVSKQNFKSAVVVNKKYTVTVRDANYQEFKNFTLTTNIYGSFSESFSLPQSVLTGNFSIQITPTDKSKSNFEAGHTNFSVEEYKRPKFEVAFQPVTETYLVNQEICVKGNANALLGTAISEATVKYRIVRKTQYARWEYWRGYQNPETQEIQVGELTTDENGGFEVVFNALPDPTKDKSKLPVFNYEITADVTDINGETRSSTTTVNVGYHSMNININTDGAFKYNTTAKINIDTQNLNGEFAPATVNLKIYKLQAPNRVLRARKLQAPDMPILSESEFIKLFPHGAYRNENDIKNWKKGAIAYDKQVDTKIQKDVTIPITDTKWKSGAYVIVVTGKDKFDNQIVQEQKIQLTNQNDILLADNQVFDAQILNTDTAKQDQYIKVKLLTATDQLKVLVESYYNSEYFYKELISVQGNQIVKIPLHKQNITPDSNVMCSFSVVKNDEHFIKTESIVFPSKKEFLTIATQTFRDKLEPNGKEKWSFTIKNQDQKGVLSEVLASMYDASLDQFKPHQWMHDISLPNYYHNRIAHKNAKNFGLGSFKVLNDKRLDQLYYNKAYAQLNSFGLHLSNNNRLFARIRNEVVETENNIPYRGSVYTKNKIRKDGNILISSDSIGYDTLQNGKIVANVLPGQITQVPVDDNESYLRTNFRDGDKSSQRLADKIGFKSIVARKNLNETAFFYSHLKTNANGDLTFEFDTPEALTRWKVQLFSHTKTGVSGHFTQQVVTQKALMVVPNPPRFLRENDTIIFQTKIVSLSDKTLNGEAKLELYDAITGEEISKVVMSTVAETSHRQTQNFKLQPKGNTSISWQLVIPETVQVIEYKVLAKSGNFSDGESSILPVLTNRMLVTESIPLTVRANSTKNYSFNKLKNNTSNTLKNQQMTLEYTTNPAWYAIQSLPYVMEFPHECAEQTFARYYANTLGSHIMNSNPKIKAVFNSWKTNGKLTSKLEQNEELKQILIAETPWLRDTQSETERKKQLGLLFDLEKLASQEKSMLKKLNQMQMGSGGFPWFKGGYENENITRHIVAGFGHLKKLGVVNAIDDNLIKNAVRYLDVQFVANHQKKLKYTTEDKIGFGYYELYYLYTRSFFKNDYDFSKEARRITNLYLNKAKKNWLDNSLQEKAMLSLVWHRFNEKSLPKLILENLQETAIINEDKGMYWKSNTSGWYWHEAPIETQALVIEAFQEITNDQKTIEELQIWLLNNKRKNNWETTKATTEAVYALLLQGNNWLSVEGTANIKIGDQKIKTSKLEATKTEAGSGYFKLNWNAEEMNPKMADISIKNTSDVTQFGGYYWQYFEQLDKITNEEHQNDIQLHKQLFVKKNTDNGPTLTKIKNTTLQVGDLVTVRIELQVKDNFEYVHLKDMRASAFEPVDVLSKYKWQDGLGYYQSTKDVATHFFFDYLRKGTYVLEYDVRVNNAGNFSNGISSIQSMYAPEFTSHSKGLTVKVSEK